MEELTQETMIAFLARLRSLLAGRTFALQDIRGHVHRKLRLQNVAKIETIEGGLWQIKLDMGGIVQPFTTYFERPNTTPLVEDAQTLRLWYVFTASSLETRLQFLSPEFRGREGSMYIILEDT